MREIVFDTETTGFKFSEGDRLVEIGCVELVNRVETGRTYHAYFNPERSMPAEAQAVLRRALRFAPQAAELRYALGLLLAEAGRFAEAAAALQAAAARAPHPRTFYNLGLAHQRAGKRAAAERAFLRGIAMAPRHPGLLQALAAFYAEAGDQERARHWARRLAEAARPPQ